MPNDSGAKQPCILVATLGKSPGVVTTTIDALCDAGYEPKDVHCLTLPRHGANADSDELFRNDEEPSVGPIEKMLHTRAQDEEWWNAKYPWQPRLIWHVLNIERPDLVDSHDHFRFFQGCASVLAQLEAQLQQDSSLTGWLSVAGGRKSMAALAHTAAFFFGPSLRLCHVTVRHDYAETHEYHWNPQAVRNVHRVADASENQASACPEHPSAALRATLMPATSVIWKPGTTKRSLRLNPCQMRSVRRPAAPRRTRRLLLAM